MKNATIRVIVTGFRGWWWRPTIAMWCFEFAAWLLGCEVVVSSGTPTVARVCIDGQETMRAVVSAMRSTEEAYHA
jgi:hypothetical protein